MKNFIPQGQVSVTTNYIKKEIGSEQNNLCN